MACTYLRQSGKCFNRHAFFFRLYTFTS